MDFRIPKAITGVICGAGLAVGGLLTQSLFRNPLTGPDVLGLTSGAGLFVAILILSGLPTAGFSITTAAISGAAVTLLMLLGLAKRIRHGSLLVAGIMVSAFASAVVSGLQYYSGAEDLQRYTLWSMGTISRTGMQESLLLMAVFFLGTGLAFASAKGLDALGLSDAYAQSMGIHVGPLKFQILIATALLTGSITAFCGPISFIGIAAPHLARQLVGTSSHRFLVPLSVLTGAILVTGCDLITQLPGDGRVLPLNAVTALTGAPVVLWILWRNRDAG